MSRPSDQISPFSDSADDLSPSGFDESWARHYLHRYGERDNLGEVVAFLRARGGAGEYLELCAGVGRIAVPLAASGARVTGVDNAPAMLAEMAGLGRAYQLETVLADCATVWAGRRFSLAYITFNSFFQLEDRAAQQATLANVARHLRPGGRLVLEAFVPRPPSPGAGGPDGTDEAVRRVWDAQEQVMWLRRVVPGESGEPTVRVVRFRYLTPAQLDDLAGEAGLAREAEFADWAERPFLPGSDNRVAVYRLRP